MGCGCRILCAFQQRVRGFPKMRDKLRRFYGQGHLHFLTFSCYRRCPLLGTVHARNLFVKTLGEVRARYGFLRVGYVAMPEHVHLRIGEPKRGTPPRFRNSKIENHLPGGEGKDPTLQTAKDGAPRTRLGKTWKHEKRTQAGVGAHKRGAPGCATPAFLSSCSLKTQEGTAHRLAAEIPVR